MSIRIWWRCNDPRIGGIVARHAPRIGQEHVPSTLLYVTGVSVTLDIRQHHFNSFSKCILNFAGRCPRTRPPQPSTIANRMAERRYYCDQCESEETLLVYTAAQILDPTRNRIERLQTSVRKCATHKVIVPPPSVRRWLRPHTLPQILPRLLQGTVVETGSLCPRRKYRQRRQVVSDSGYSSLSTRQHSGSGTHKRIQNTV